MTVLNPISKAIILILFKALRGNVAGGKSTFELTRSSDNPIKGDVSDSQLNAGRESFWAPSGNK